MVRVRSAAMVARPERARAEHGHHVAGVDLGVEGGVHGAGGRLDHDGVVVAQLVGDDVELAAVGDQPGGRPPAAGVGAVADLQARGEMAEGDALAAARAAFAAGGARRRDAAGDAAEHRLDHHPGARRRAPSSPALGVGAAASSTTPTTSWPGTKGKLTSSSK